MKKILFLLGGIITPAACSEDVYQEIDEQNEQLANEQNANNVGKQTNSFDDSQSGGIGNVQL